MKNYCITFYRQTKRAIQLGLVLSLSACGSAPPPDKSIEVAAIGINTAALDPTGKYAIIGSIHHGISFWDLEKKERKYNWNHKQGEQTTLTAASFSPDGNWAITADTHNLSLWDTHTGKSPRFWRAPAEILDVDLGTQGNFALLGLSDYTAVIFDIRKGGIQRTFTHSNRVRSVSFSQDSRVALTGSEDYSTRAYDPQKNKEINRIVMADDVQIVALSPDGTLAFSMAKYDTALVWRTTDKTEVGRLKLKGNLLKFGIRYLAARISEDNKHLLVGRSDQKVELWKIEGFTKLYAWELPKRKTWKPQGVAVLDVSFTEKPKQFVAVASNGFVHYLSRP